MATRTRKTPITLPAGLTAREVLALVDDGTTPKAEASAYLQARVDAALAAGRRPRYATVKAIEALTGKAPEFDRAKALTRKQAKAASVEAAPAPKAPAKRKAAPKAKAAPQARAPSVQDLIALLGGQLAGAGPAEIAAAFTAIAQLAARK